MKRNLVLIFLFLFSGKGFAEELPNSCYGKYGGEMPAYTVEVDGAILDIEEHDVFIEISPEGITYTGGNLELSGNYTVFKQSKNEYVIKSELSNGKSLNYEIDFIWNKKEEKIYITPKNGQSEAVLERMDN